MLPKQSHTNTKVAVGQAYEYQITAKISNTTYEPNGYLVRTTDSQHQTSAVKMFVGSSTP